MLHLSMEEMQRNNGEGEEEINRNSSGNNNSSDIFEGLPPPSSTSQQSVTTENDVINPSNNNSVQRLPVPPAKGALKRTAREFRADDQAQSTATHDASSKRVRFKTTMDATEKQVIDAMQKITTHIGNPSKFCKASKLALQLVQAGSLNSENSSYFFELLQASMQSPTSCNDPALRADYHELFAAVQDILNLFTPQQQKQLEAWIIRAYVANDFLTDDSFVFSKASARVRQAISSLSEVSQEIPLNEDILNSSEGVSMDSNAKNLESKEDTVQSSRALVKHVVVDEDGPENDPFGLDVLLSNKSKKEDGNKVKKEVTASDKKANNRMTNHQLEQREALMQCLKIAAGRYKVTWAQTMIDILVKHAFDNRSRFPSEQSDAIDKLWASIREQQMWRKQGKNTSGKLDVSAFERLQGLYATKKISIRRAVGGGGERHAEQWLG